MDIKKNDNFTVEIEDISEDGAGIGKKDGYIWFIKDTVIGDIVEVKAMKMKKSYGFARLIKVLKSSPNRVEPACPVARQCGGCQLQAMSYKEQLRFKENKVYNNLVRIGELKELQRVAEESGNGRKDELEPGTVLALEDVAGENGNKTEDEKKPKAVLPLENAAGGGEYRSGDKRRASGVFLSIMGMENPWRYRNKAQFPFGADKEGNIVTGFFAGHTHMIIPQEDCLLGVKENSIVLKIVKSYMEQYHISPYEENRHQGLIRHVLIRKGFFTGQVMVCVVINGRKLPKADKLAERLREIPGMASISYSMNTEKTNVIMGKEVVHIYGPGYIEDFIGDVKYRISPLSFYQVNPVQTEKLYQMVLEYAALTGNETVWDLYCGIGTISLFLARKAKQVFGVEIVSQAIEDARQNAALNGFTNVEFFVGKAEDVLPDEYEKNHILADVIVVDPPRKGCDEKCLETIVKIGPQRVVYVSCDSATLARDLRYLCDGGYEVRKVRCCDMFGWGVHVETVVCLSQ